MDSANMIELQFEISKAYEAHCNKHKNGCDACHYRDDEMCSISYALDYLQKSKKLSKRGNKHE